MWRAPTTAPSCNCILTAAVGQPTTGFGADFTDDGQRFLTIGSEDGRADCPSCTVNRYFKGQIDEASVYNRALSAAEVAAIYGAGTTGSAPV